MKLNDKLFAGMRQATRNLLAQGPAAATSAIQHALQGVAAKGAPAPAAPPMRDINPPPPTARAARPAPQPEVAAAAAAEAPTPLQGLDNMMRNLVPEMMANLDRVSEAGKSAFTMPHFEMPAFDLHAAMGGQGAAPAEALPGKFIDGSHTNSAGTRSYKLYVPSSYDGATAVPLVVMLHGCTQDPVDFASGTQMNQLAEELGCLVAYPAQSQQANSSRCWNWFHEKDQMRDQGEPSIIAGITRDIMAAHHVDATQVYVAGLSAGGAMATIMGTVYPELYAAVGVHSGLPFASAHDLPSALAAMQGKFGTPPAPGTAIPIIVFHGDRDTTVSPAAGDAVIAQGTHHGARDIVIEPGKVPEGHAYTRTVHRHADGTPHAEQWLIHGAGHAWSGGSARGSYTDGKGPDASREMMRFFQTKR
ncbi:extracellular catalytic domain type 1 short-chain-length polyhydroxyalkanoate depolymerase [Massilia sp. DWR3-1-1]|uniref:extracellular catalytic domain type 1 short-chain-length polyhydroxyalkanoate depolymerase n=1 Tax=Massilia sp. DWR3-1-1 TaxID=2804559 RepID=UPI003CF61F29